MLLSPHLDRQTTSEERVAVEQHLAGCAACQGILSSYQQIDRRLARLRSRGPSLAVAYDVTRILRGDKPAPSQAKGNGRRRMLVGLVGVTSVALIACMSGLLLTRRGAGHSAGMLYVALQNNEGQVAVVDAQDSRLVNTISVGARPTRLAVTRDGARLYALLDSGLIAVIDTTQGIVTDRYLVGGRLNGMALAPDGKILYVTIPDRRVVLAIDAETGRSDGEMRVGRTPREIAVTPDGQWLVVYNSGDNTLSRIRVSAKQEAKVYRLFRERDGLTDFSLHPLALTPDGRKVYVCEVNRERIWSVDLVTDEVLSFEVPLRDLGRDLAVSTGGDRLFVTHGDARGSRAALAGLASMALPKVERNAEIRGFFNAVALNPDGTTLYATNQDENSVICAGRHSSGRYRLCAQTTLAVIYT
jgi:DNA-binding beta-propeller fold protein YncE